MSAIASLYTRSTKLIKDDESVKVQPEEDAGHHQLRMSWKEATITKEFIEEDEKELTRLFNECIVLANGSYANPQNKDKIVNHLIRIDVIRDRINQYLTGKAK